MLGIGNDKNWNTSISFSHFKKLEYINLTMHIRKTVYKSYYAYKRNWYTINLIYLAYKIDMEYKSTSKPCWCWMFSNNVASVDGVCFVIRKCKSQEKKFYKIVSKL